MAPDSPDATRPPNGLPRYRLLTGGDDAEFCRRVSEALDLGYRPFGSPVMCHGPNGVCVGQAVLWPDVGSDGIGM